MGGPRNIVDATTHASICSTDSLPHCLAWSQGNHYGVSSSVLFHELAKGRFQLLNVTVDVSTYVVDKRVITAEVKVPRISA